MTLTELRYIVAVAQERNFRRAAETVFVSQPALSLAIQKLEDELGVQIFERNRTSVSFTPIGEMVVKQAQRALEEVAQIKAIANQGKDQLVGTLRLGVIYTVGPYLLPDLIPVLKRKAPKMPLEMEENTTANLQDQLANSRLDVIIIALPFDGPGIATLPLYDEDFNVVVPLDHPWAKKKIIKTAELSTEKILLLVVFKITLPFKLSDLFQQTIDSQMFRIVFMSFYIKIFLWFYIKIQSLKVENRTWFLPARRKNEKAHFRFQRSGEPQPDHGGIFPKNAAKPKLAF